MNSFDNGANAAKEIKPALEKAKKRETEKLKPQVKDSVTVLTYKNGILINEERKIKL
ncbi:MAG: hypothetical protein ABI892_04485 [Flavobacterium sp.]